MASLSWKITYKSKEGESKPAKMSYSLQTSFTGEARIAFEKQVELYMKKLAAYYERVQNQKIVFEPFRPLSYTAPVTDAVKA